MKYGFNSIVFAYTNQFLLPLRVGYSCGERKLKRSLADQKPSVVETVIRSKVLIVFDKATIICLFVKYAPGLVINNRKTIVMAKPL